MKKWLLAFIFGLIATTAVAQVQNNLSGNETWQAGQGPGGPGDYITSNLVRNSTAVALVALSGNHTIGTGNSANLNWGGNLLVSAQPSAPSVLTMPANPVPNGAMVGVCNTTATAWVGQAVTVAGNTGQTPPAGANATLTTLAAGTCAWFQFWLATTTWYRVQ